MMSSESVENKTNPFENSVAPLSEGLLKVYEPHLKAARSQLEELTTKQNLLVGQIHDENLQLAELQHSQELQNIFNKIGSYQATLINIRKDMKHLHEKSIKLKKRTLKLQQVKNQQDYLKKKKENELKLEEELIGKAK